MSPDTQQNIFYTVYFILLHNFEAVLYSCGIIFTTLWMLYKPSRAKILILWGFIFLLFSFEYKKHIVEGLTEQTINSLITERQSYRIERYVNVTLNKLVPLALPLGGWILIVGGTVLKIYEHQRSPK
ncbi:hypothetical protein A3F59_05020 [Candidatus Roizmanbacteria bacterium RIFCSPHIGHO2_12_FULL_38_13]|nr:MAG: hypothetical protein A3F59_05020 [Candidatus Roizmanbacteria bacterium RIFCSPHIGHO2_12_FULL_38_13]